jgi:hypothetical protein
MLLGDTNEVSIERKIIMKNLLRVAVLWTELKLVSFKAKMLEAYIKLMNKKK